MTDSSDTITLIVPDHARPTGESLDSGKPVTHAVPGRPAEIVTQAVAIDAALIRENIDKCLAQLKQVFANLEEPSIDGWSVGTITVGLAVTAQGSVGVATAGIQAVLEIAFKPNG
jgi:hypothetical protein